MREDEDRRQWEAELAKQLEIEQLEHEMKRNREVRHPVPEHHPERGAHISRRGWNRLVLRSLWGDFFPSDLNL